MDDRQPPFEEEAHTLLGPHFRVVNEPAPGFVPLRLQLLRTGQSFEVLQDEVLLGRHSEAGVRLSFPEVSRKHCRIAFEQGFWRLYDLDSMNGVYINGVRVTEATLQGGDTVSLGSVMLSVELIEALCRRRENVLKSIADVLPKHSE